MLIQLNQPIGFSHIGQRTVNQDAVYPPVGRATEESRLFLVCDGMGGADKGEVASQLLCENFIDYARAMDFPPFDLVHLRTALGQVAQAYQAYLTANPFVGRMGSTLALLQFHNAGVTVAHIGDSRVYQIRDREILFRTQDHRQVLDMVADGIITAEQAQTHPWRNRLSRAVVAEAGRDNTLMPMPDEVTLTDIRSGDYFFLCTDGVGECIDDDMLTATLGAGFSDQTKLQTLLAVCTTKARDNFSGYLLSVRQVSMPELSYKTVFAQ